MLGGTFDSQVCLSLNVMGAVLLCFVILIKVLTVTSLRSLPLFGIDELTEFDADQFLILIGSLRWVGIDHHPFIAGSNPDGIGNDWVKACFIDKDYSNQQLAGLKNMADQFNFVRSLATDNPYLPKEYYQILDAQPPARRRAWRDGDWNVIQGAAFPEFSTDTHVATTILT